MGLRKYLQKYKKYERGVLSRRVVAKEELRKIKNAERQAYLKEAQEQARLRGIRIAKAQYNRPGFSTILKQSIKPRIKQPIVKVKRRKVKRKKRRKYVYY